MSKTLVLRGRMPEPFGRLTWHDGTVLLIAIGNIAKDKNLGKMATWIAIAGKIQAVMEKEGVEDRTDFGVDEETGKKIWGQKMVDVSIAISDNVAHNFWRELEKLNWRDFGVAPQTSGTLCLMLADIASQLGEKTGETDDEEHPSED